MTYNPEKMDRELGVVTEMNPAAKDETGNVLKTIDDAIAKLKDGDDGAHWEPDVIETARYLFQNDKPLFQRKRSELKKASSDAQITEWTKEVKGGGDDSQDSTKADELVGLVSSSAELFHNSRGVCYATFKQETHMETWALGSVGFTDWLGFKAYSELGFSPSDVAAKQAITALNGLAKYDGEEREVYLRCAPCDGGVIIDLSNDKWQAIKVTPQSWEVVNQPEVRFTRSSTSSPLPIPVAGDIGRLWKHVNIPKEQRLLILAFLLESWRFHTPFVILMLTGEQGSAKSSTHKRIRQLSDPNTVPLRSAPKSVEDIYVSAANNWQASFENMSNLSAPMQDALCTLATGGGFAGRKLYSDADESVIDVKRPVIINGIANVTTRPDLIDRTITLHLPRIEESDRKCDADLDRDFEEDAPTIFGSLLDLFSATLRELPDIHIDRPPRMIDFVYLGEAMCKAMNIEPSTFNTLYKENRGESLMHSLDSSPAALAVQEFVKSGTNDWKGTMKQLKAILDASHHQEGEGWPKSPRGLGETLRRMAPALRELGVEIEFRGRRNDGVHVHIYSIPVFSESKNNVHNAHTFTETDEIDEKSVNSEHKGEQVNIVNVENGLEKKPDRDIPANVEEF